MFWKEFVDKIKYFEGFREKAYKDSAGNLTIGYGFTKSIIPELNEKMTITKNYADKLLEKLLNNELNYVASLVDDSFSYDSLLALTSFSYNCGHKALEKILHRKDILEMGDALLLYNKCTINGKKVELKGLTKRRKWEYELLTTNIYRNAQLVVFIEEEPHIFTGFCKTVKNIDYAQFKNLKTGKVKFFEESIFFDNSIVFYGGQ